MTEEEEKFQEMMMKKELEAQQSFRKTCRPVQATMAQAIEAQRSSHQIQAQY